MAEEYTECLLENNKYHEHCPGCKVDQMKKSRRGFPFSELLSVWIIVLCTALPISSLFPFLYFMISDFDIAKKEEDIGFYAGFVGCSFMLGRTLTSVIWGIIADRYGRKPVILIGTASVVIFNTLFGLSVNFWMAIITRFCLGSFNGLLGPIKAYAIEIFRDEYQGLALSAVSTAWGIGLIIGPAMGGFLAQPAKQYPSLFSEESVFGKWVIEKMAEEYTECLLENNKYHEHCPGCKVDQMKKSRRGFPFSELLSVWIIVLCTALPISSLFPFLYFMISDFDIAKKEEDIGFYAGFVDCSFMLGRTLTSVIWGIMADRYGRKPVILIGTASVVIFNTLFGLSVNFWMAIITRFCLGSFNGLLGPIKAYAIEIFRDEYQGLALSAVSTAWGIGLIIGPAMGGFLAQAYAIEIFRDEYQGLALSAVSTAWGIGLIIGPAMGGFLAQPAKQYPSLFSEESVFGKFPYFLPCLVISCFALLVTIVSLRIPETLHNHKTADDASSHDESIKFLSHDPESHNVTERNENTSLLKNWPLISSIIVYCILSLHDMAYTEVFSLWANSPRKYGGLGYSSADVGSVLAFSGFGLLVFQLSLYSYAERLLGPIVVTRISGSLGLVLLSSYPLIAKLSGLALTLTLNCASVAKNVLSVSAITGLFILQNNAVGQDQRGAANGLAMTGMSLFKAIGPAAAGIIYSWSEKRQDAAFLPGTQMVFFILNTVLALGVVLTFKPFLAETKQ
ncbi:hypothetical protein F2Q69_00000551 [Brassica cretica]|uniref:Major facilitator superfamily (MFS) profile domain-containing protein n=1 Tax=Brassica cretica TaxID=69181 RepID=A0A8S9P3V1_BRACR|nr:hypothetical protein F2Q69_00000551 [Brassica cretica]